MLKKDARKLFIQKRKDVSISDKLKWDDLVLIQFQTIELPFVDNVLSFYPMEDKLEVNTFLLTDYLHFKNPSLRICYPKMNAAENTMNAIACHADSIFEANEFNILEPLDTEIIPAEDVDLVLIPLLACDMQGHRVGYGKGYYDRYLKDCRSDCIKVGLSFFPPVEVIDDANEFDVPLNFCITPERAYVF